MLNQAELQDAWRKLVAGLEKTKVLQYSVGSLIKELQNLGLKASHLLGETKNRSLDELAEILGRRADSPTQDDKSGKVENDSGEKADKIPIRVEVINVFLNKLNELRQELHSELFELKQTLKDTPVELLKMLNDLRDTCWRAQLLLFYVDRLRVLPGPDRPMGSDIWSLDDLPGIYRTLDLMSPLAALLERFEQFDVFSSWQTYLSNADYFLADLEAIRLEIGTDPPEGPIPPDSWRFEGRLYKGLKPTAWRLVDFLWSKPDWRASFDEIATPVFVDEKAIVTQTLLGSHRKGANSFFGENAIPYRVSLSKDTVLLVEDTPESRHG